ncbi:hypothetical protein JD844_003694 [Phrynosoma platyrhinos]|uniref:Protein-cysteine N-palmitoyltransferase HHAT-like protein n=1 Tax=Phrynosoma platyrhinos TaxID=52577 RepID=A0ABQ7TDC0_PHRPL|nr:hypothetical protein JD844_003694 [Phrynosoma platyrhinos]
MGIKTRLPIYELGLYALVVLGAIVYSGMEILESSQESMNQKSFQENIKPGWHYFGRKMHRSVVYMVYGMLMVLGTMGTTYLMIILSHCLVLYTIALTKQKWVCFAAGLCSLASFKNGFVTGTFDLQDVLFYGGSGFSIMRCMSFALENCEKKEGNYSIFALLKYNFYLPFFFFGPVMTFDRFYEQVHISELRRKDYEMWHIRVHAVIHLLAIVIVDVFFHFFYILTLPSDMNFVSQLSDWALATSTEGLMTGCANLLHAIAVKEMEPPSPLALEQKDQVVSSMTHQ